MLPLLLPIGGGALALTVLISYLLSGSETTLPTHLLSTSQGISPSLLPPPISSYQTNLFRPSNLHLQHLRRPHRPPPALPHLPTVHLLALRRPFDTHIPALGHPADDGPASEDSRAGESEEGTCAG